MSPTAIAALPPFRVQVFRLRGELDRDLAQSMRNTIGEFIQAGQVNVIVNLEGVTHVHPSAMVILNERRNRLREYRGDLKIAGASPFVRNVFNLMGVGQAFDFCADEEEAGKHFGWEAAA